MYRIVRRELVIIEQYPAQGLETFFGAVGSELAGGLGGPDQNRARLGHSLPTDFEHRDLTHRVGAGAPVCISCLAAGEINADRLPVEAGAIQIERQFVGVARAAIAMELIVGHSLMRSRASASAAVLPCPTGARVRYWATAATGRAGRRQS